MPYSTNILKAITLASPFILIACGGDGGSKGAKQEWLSDLSLGKTSQNPIPADFKNKGDAKDFSDRLSRLQELQEQSFLVKKSRTSIYPAFDQPNLSVSRSKLTDIASVILKAGRDSSELQDNEDTYCGSGLANLVVDHLSWENHSLNEIFDDISMALKARPEKKVFAYDSSRVAFAYQWDNKLLVAGSNETQTAISISDEQFHLDIFSDLDKQIMSITLEAHKPSTQLRLGWYKQVQIQGGQNPSLSIKYFTDQQKWNRLQLTSSGADKIKITYDWIFGGERHDLVPQFVVDSLRCD